MKIKKQVNWANKQSKFRIRQVNWGHKVLINNCLVLNLKLGKFFKKNLPNCIYLAPSFRTQ